jgi:hypothetical protein
MARRTLVRTGQRVETGREHFDRLYRLAADSFPEKFTAEETQEPRELLDYVPLGWVDAMRKEIAAKLDLSAAIMSLDRFAVYSCGPIAWHDDRHNYPDLYFVIVIVHAGRLGVVERKTETAHGHEPGEILLLDPYGKHALIPAGTTLKDYRYEKTHSAVSSDEDRFLFLSFDVKRRDLRERFRAK